jgi:hypothetical protein
MAFLMRRKESASSALRVCLAALGFTHSRPPARLAFALLSTGFVILTIMACAQAAPAGDNKLEQNFSYAFAMRGCTQEDAPALEIYLTQTPFTGVGDPSPPYIRVEISSTPDETIEPASLQLIQMRRDQTKKGRVVRAELAASQRDHIWLSGTLTLSEAVPGGRVSGRYDFTTPTGRHLNSSFSAEYSKRPAVCG